MEIPHNIEQGVPFEAECFEIEHLGDYKLVWKWSWKKPTTTQGGTTGWATILETNSDKHFVGEDIRIHYCRFYPCKADWGLSKYGDYGRCIHMVDHALALAASGHTSSSNAIDSTGASFTIP